MTDEWEVCPRCRGPICVYPRRPLDDADKAMQAEGALLLGAYCISYSCGWGTSGKYQDG